MLGFVDNVDTMMFTSMCALGQRWLLWSVVHCFEFLFRFLLILLLDVPVRRGPSVDGHTTLVFVLSSLLVFIYFLFSFV